MATVGGSIGKSLVALILGSLMVLVGVYLITRGRLNYLADSEDSEDDK